MVCCRLGTDARRLLAQLKLRTLPKIELDLARFRGESTTPCSTAALTLAPHQCASELSAPPLCTSPLHLLSALLLCTSTSCTPRCTYTLHLHALPLYRCASTPPRRTSTDHTSTEGLCTLRRRTFHGLLRLLQACWAKSLLRQTRRVGRLPMTRRRR